MSQFLRPSSDLAQDGAWESIPDNDILWDKLDEISPNDGDYAWHNAIDVGDYFEVALSDPGETPALGTNTIRWRLQRIGGSNGTQVKCELREGAVVKASQEVAITDALQALDFSVVSGTYTTGWKNAASGTSVDRDGKQFWTNPTQAKTQDDTYAHNDLGEDYGDWLTLKRFSFSDDIPVSAIILGIEVEIDGYAEVGGTVKDSAVYLQKTSGLVGDNKADTVTIWPNSDTDTYVSYGGSSDTWNAGLSDSDVRSIDFGVRISLLGDNFPHRYAYVDHVRMKVHWAWAISDYSDLRLRFTIPSVTKKGDDVAIMWAEMEVPDGGEPPAPTFKPQIIMIT